MDAFTLEKIEFDAVRRILSGYCRCSLGKALALKISPSTRPGVVRNWLEQTSQMVDALRDFGLPPFGGVTDITEALARAVPGHGGGAEDFSQIASTLEGVANVRAYLQALPEEMSHLHELGRMLADFNPEVEAIRTIIGPTGEVRDDASTHLRELRSKIAETTTKIHEVIHSYLRNPEVKKLLSSANVTLHGDRYVLPVRADNRGRLPGVVHRESNTGQTVFVEPNESVQLNNLLVDLHDHERMEIERLLSELGLKIVAKAEPINTAVRTLGKVDLLAGKAQYAYQFKMVCPDIVDFTKNPDTQTPENGSAGFLEFFQVRHPLLEALAHKRSEVSSHSSDDRDVVVPIDIRLGSDFDILIITGSNTGGKTVTLKSVALLVAMAQSGMHIPARRGAKMPVFNDVLIDIGDEQSLEQSLSTFGGHIQRLKYILRQAKRNTLVLLDELGSGTDPDEGGAIGQAVLDELQNIGCLALVSTHFSILKAYAMNHDRVDNASVEFDTQTLRPTYHLRIGTPGESHAITVAQKLGLPGRVVDAARKHLGQRGGQLRKALRKTGAARRDAEDARSAAAEAEFQAMTHGQQLQAKIDDVNKLKAEFATWLARLAEMKPGHEIYIPSVDQKGTLARLELHKQIAVINVGSLQLEVPLTELMPDLGQQAIRRELTEHRRTAVEKSQETAEKLLEVENQLKEARKFEKLHKERAKSFDMWLSRIARLKIGDEISVNCPPGHAKVVSVDLPGLRATVEIKGGQVKQLSLQDLFPQDGPFAQKTESSKKAGGKRRRREDSPARSKPKPQQDRPIKHGQIQGKAADKNRKKVLATKPGEKIFVVPFNTAATLVRIDESKGKAIVLRGAFEMQVALSDLEPVGYEKDRQ